MAIYSADLTEIDEFAQNFLFESKRQKELADSQMYSGTSVTLCKTAKKSDEPPLENSQYELMQATYSSLNLGIALSARKRVEELSK